jgi:MinD-like ATPase involved in chromosome partitioning or flagellar assembly
MPVISILGTKGGVGKSTVAMGITCWLSKLQDDMVLLIDGDIHVRTVELKMCPGTDLTLAHFLEGKCSLADAVYACQLRADGKPLFPKLAILPAGGRFLPPGSRDMVSFVQNTVKRFERMLSILRKKFSYIIVDTPASVGFEHLILTAIADGLLYVVNPDVDSILSAKQTALGLKQLLGLDGIGVVLNRVPRNARVEEWTIQAEEIARVLGVVEDDELVEDAFRRDLPVVALYPESPASLSLRSIASELMRLEIPTTKLAPKFELALGKK